MQQLQTYDAITLPFEFFIFHQFKVEELFEQVKWAYEKTAIHHPPTIGNIVDEMNHVFLLGMEDKLLYQMGGTIQVLAGFNERTKEVTPTNPTYHDLALMISADLMGDSNKLWQQFANDLQMVLNLMGFSYFPTNTSLQFHLSRFKTYAVPIVNNAIVEVW